MIEHILSIYPSTILIRKIIIQVPFMTGIKVRISKIFLCGEGARGRWLILNFPICFGRWVNLCEWSSTLTNAWEEKNWNVLSRSDDVGDHSCTLHSVKRGLNKIQNLKIMSLNMKSICCLCICLLHKI